MKNIIRAFVGGLAFTGLITGEEPSPAVWNQFRGPNGSGVLNEARPPLDFSADHPTWKTAVPPANSSPVLWGGRLYLTGAEAGRLVTLALDTRTGRVRWKQRAPETPLQRVHAGNTVAASTPCVDEFAVYVYFGSYGLIAYDHAGRELWKRPIPTPKNMYGVATSPVVHGERLFLLDDDDENLPDSTLSRSKLIAFDKRTGAMLWATPRPYNRGAWSTPMLWRHDGEADLVVLGNGRLYAYDPDTGAERWFVSGFAREPIAVPVAGNGLLYASASMQGGRGDAKLDPEPFWQAMLNFDADGDGRIGRDEITEQFTLPFRPEMPPGHPGFGLPLPANPEARRRRQLEIFRWRDKDRDGYWTREEFTADMRVGRGRPNLAAVRPGGHGDVTETHVAWHLRTGIPEIPSPLYHQGRLYLVRDGGILTCVNAGSGTVIYKQRLGAGNQYVASPVLANEHLILVSGRGVLSVVPCGDTFRVAHRAALGEAVSSTPALDADSLYVRTRSAVLCFRRRGAAR